jgi:mono/diheme cytochrome c family protein
MQATIMKSQYCRVIGLGFVMLFLVACHYDMYDQPKYQTYEPSSFFEDGRASRPAVAGAVSTNGVQTDAYLYTGLNPDGTEGTELPFPVSQELLLRGQEQYNIYCAVCHGETGYGDSVVAQRGAIVPANFHQQRLVDAPIGHIYNVITNGYRAMYSYASRITPEDRWAIAAYVRALQLSQNATLDDVPAAERAKLESQ